MDEYAVQLEKQYFDEEVRRSFQNINYSQWERKKSAAETKLTSISANNLAKDNNKRATKSAKAEKKCSKLCNHGEFVTAKGPNRARKSKRQLLKEEEEAKILTLKIRNTRDAIESLQLREKDLIDANLTLHDYINSTEENAHENVDEILGKYEKYKNVLATMTKKHAKEKEELIKEMKRIENHMNLELPIHENRLKKVNDELQKVSELCKILSTYKNQEYPEKLLQIKNLQKEVLDLHNVHAEEKDELVDMISKETNRLHYIQIETEKSMVKNIFEKTNDEMHESIRDVAKDNSTMKEEKLFHKDMIERLKNEIKILEDEIIILLKDQRRHTRKMIYPEFYKKPQPICTPDMDVILDI